jgi:hypothetical protein
MARHRAQPRPEEADSLSRSSPVAGEGAAPSQRDLKGDPDHSPQNHPRREARHLSLPRGSSPSPLGGSSPPHPALSANVGETPAPQPITVGRWRESGGNVSLGSDPCSAGKIQGNRPYSDFPSGPIFRERPLVRVLTGDFPRFGNREFPASNREVRQVSRESGHRNRAERARIEANYPRRRNGREHAVSVPDEY